MDARVDRSEDIVPLEQVRGYGLLLTLEERIRVGEFAHILHLGKTQYYTTRSRSILNSVHVTGVSQADDLMSRLGRRGREPWFAPRYRERLSYIDENLVTLPCAHLLLRGILHSFISLSVGKVKGWKTPKPEEGSPLMLTTEAITAIKVSACAYENGHTPACLRISLSFERSKWPVPCSSV